MRRIKMMKLGLLMVTGLFTTSAMSQDYYHGIGLQYNVGLYNLSYTSPSMSFSGTTVAGVPGLVYKATLGLNDNMGISAYPFLGLNMTVNSQSGGSGSFGFDLPINFEYYLGDMSDACFYAGAGFAYQFLANAGDGDVAGGSVMGPQFALGGQFEFKDKLIGARAAYTLGVNKSKVDIPDVKIEKDSKSMISIGFYYVLGN